jgi:hypothetical protein
MFYEEAIIDGVLSCRFTPDVPMHPMSREELTTRIVNLEHKVRELRTDPRMRLEFIHVDVLNSALDLLIDDYGNSSDDVLEAQELLLSIEAPHQDVTQPHLFEDRVQVRA